MPPTTEEPEGALTIREAALKLKEERRRRKRPIQVKQKGLPVPEAVTFQYYGRPQKRGDRITLGNRGARDHHGVMTVAIFPAGRGLLHLGVSFCSPQDAWCKVKGRDLAMERLFDDPIIVPYIFEPQRTAMHVAGALAVRDFSRLTQAGVILPPTISKTVPGWAKKMAAALRAQKSTSQRKRLDWIEEAAPAKQRVFDKLKSYRSPGIPISRRSNSPSEILFRMLQDILNLGKP